MNDYNLFIKMLRDANANFEIEEKSVTVYSDASDFLIFDFDEHGKLIRVS